MICLLFTYQHANVKCRDVIFRLCFVYCDKEKLSLKYTQLNSQKNSLTVLVGNVRETISWSFVTTINRRPVTGMKKGHNGHYMANRKDRDLEWRFLIAIRSIMFRRQWMHVQKPDTNASRRSAERVSMRLTCHSKKGAFYLDILRIIIERRVSIKTLHFSSWRFFRLWLMGDGVSALCGVCCNTSKPEGIQGYRRLDSGVHFRQVGFNSRYWLHCQWLYIPSFLLEFKGFWDKHWKSKTMNWDRHQSIWKICNIVNPETWNDR